MTIVFSNSSPKLPKYEIRHFFGPNLGIFVFLLNFSVRQIRGCWFQIWQKFFLILAQKYPNKAFLVPNLGIFLFWGGNLELDSIRRCLFQIWQYFLKILAQKSQIRHFWSQIFTLLFFRKILQIDKFEGADFKYDKRFLKF